MSGVVVPMVESCLLLVFGIMMYRASSRDCLPECHCYRESV